MLERIVQIKIPIQKAMLDLDENINVSHQELSLISSVVEALSPINIALEALFRRDTNLIDGSYSKVSIGRSPKI